MRIIAAVAIALLSLPAFAQERVLVPVAYDGPGAFGSFWSTWVGGWNRTAVPWRSPGIGFIVHEGCPIPEGCFAEELAPGLAAQIVTSFDLFDAPRGFLIQLPPGQSTRPAVWGRFASEENIPFATELPIPAESEFTTGILFLPLATTGIYPVRTLLRIYALDNTRAVTVRVNARPMFSASTFRSATAVVQPASGPNLPGYGELSLTQAFGDRLGFADIEIVQEPDPAGAPPARLWAFITMTDLETNAVGVVTPR